MSNINYYTILGIEENASLDMIKQAYRRLSLELHPDKTKNNVVLTEKYKQINEAYEVLKDKEKKYVYDLQNIKKMRTNNNFDIGNFMDILNGVGINNINDNNINDNNINSYNINDENFHVVNLNTIMKDIINNKSGLFNNVNLNKMMNKPPPIIKKIIISLHEAFTGCKKPIEIERWICSDKLKHNEKETLYITIHNGIDDNEIIIIREKGNILDDFNKGDVKIFINVINNTHFKRQGMDLIFNKNITLKEALCGFTLEFEHLDDRLIKINNHNGNVISSCYKKVIKDLGMKRDKNKGNLIICFNVLFPKKLSNNIIEKLKNIL